MSRPDHRFPLNNVRRVLEAFEASTWDEIHLRADGFELHVVTGEQDGDGRPPSMAGSSARLGPTPMPDTTGRGHVEVDDPPPVVEEPTAAGSWSGARGVEIVVSAPSLGIFWRSPRPGAPPFVDVDDEVTPDVTMCIVEVMKLMTPLKAGTTGRVARVLVENGQPVEMGQPLFAVTPSVNGSPGDSAATKVGVGAGNQCSVDG